mgnify:CR=1 FL=1
MCLCTKPSLQPLNFFDSLNNLGNEEMGGHQFQNESKGLKSPCIPFHSNFPGDKLVFDQLGT